MRRIRKLTNTLILIACVTALCWAFIPGLGPDLAHLDAKWKEWGLAQLDQLFRPNPEVVLKRAPQTQLIKALRSLHIDDNHNRRNYSRTAFGPAWSDTDHNGCDTRNDILKRDLSNVRFKASSLNCVVASGSLMDPYTGKLIQFQRGQGTSEAVQIDHVVALGDAWRSGADNWDSQKRLRYANDPLVLLAVDGQANQDKGRASADQWLPPNRGYRCAYVARQVAIKIKYDLSVTTTELAAMSMVAASCPNEPLPH